MRNIFSVYFNQQEALKTIENLNYIRTCGSEGEIKALHFIHKQLKKCGLNPILHSYKEKWVEPINSYLILEKYKIPVEPVVPLSFLASFKWMRREGLNVNISGKLLKPWGEASELASKILIDRFRPKQKVTSNVVGQIFFDKNPELIPYLLASEKFIPSAYVSKEYKKFITDFLGKTGRLRWNAKQTTRRFFNLVLIIKGYKFDKEVVVMCAHTDSFPGTVGASDNACGCAVLLEIAKWFKVNPPERTAILCWFSGEELDRRGSRHFIKDYHQFLRNAILVINIDGGFEKGAGVPFINISTRSLLPRVRKWFRNFEIRIRESKSSNAASFQSIGIPTFWMTAHSKHSMHLPTDCPQNISSRNLRLIGKYSLMAGILFTSSSIGN